MLCEKCGKNTATVTFTRVVNGEKSVQHLCQNCMQEEEQGFTAQFAGMPQALANLFADYQEKSAGPELRCEKCGTTWSRFKKNGEVGCADCYNAFRAQLTPVLKRVHGNAKHAGKLPRGASEEARARSEMEKLRQQLAQAVAGEEYETAAKLRDEIKALEMGGASHE